MLPDDDQPCYNDGLSATETKTDDTKAMLDALPT